ncbi:hypothetical protein LEA_00004, partial [human gut metagenome]
MLWLFDDGHFGCSVGDIDLVGDPDRIVEFQGDFGVMTDAGMFDKIIGALMKKVGNNVVGVAL